jgi:hypothetical protein
MARKTRQQLLSFFKTEEGLNKILTIKNGLDNKTIKTFPQIFATIAKSNLHILLGGEFYAFDKKIENPGKFSTDDIEILADFFQVQYDTMHGFIRNIVILNKKNTKRKTK